MPNNVNVRLAWVKDWTLLGCVILLILGILFRFGNLNQVYWHDEAYTSLRMSGYDAVEVNDALYNSRLSTLDDLMRYQWPTPERQLIDTVRSLASEDPQHPPLYYILVRQWVTVFGQSIWITRSFSALVSLLTFPAIYWLYQELFIFSDRRQSVSKFQRKLTGGIAMMLVATSPFHILYAQEARQYALWTVLILALSALLLRAMRRHTLLSWGLYTALLALSLYTHPFSGFVALGHGAYILTIERCRPTRRVIAYSLCMTVGCLCFAPWLSIFINKLGETGTSWTAQPIPLLILLKIWGLHLVRSFILTKGDFGFDTWQVYVTLPLALLLVGYSLYFMCRQTPIRFWLFVLIFIGASCLPLVGPDLILGGQRSTAGRYLIPSVLGLQMAIAFLLAMKIRHANLLKRQVWKEITTAVLILGVMAGFEILHAETSWIKGINHYLPSLARVVNESPNPLVVCASGGINFGSIFALGYRLEPDVQFLLVDGRQGQDNLTPPQLPKGLNDVFLLNPSDAFRKNIERQEKTKANLVFNDFHLYLWKL